LGLQYRQVAFLTAITKAAIQMEKAMALEFEALYINNTWNLVKLPIDKKAIGCK